MKIFKDITSSPSWDNNDILLKTDISHEPEVGILELENTNDLAWGNQLGNITMQAGREIQLSKKIIKNFDALETTTSKKKDIRLLWKKKILFPPIFLYAQRYLKWFQLQFPKIFFISLFSFVVMLWWTTKLVIESQVNSGYSKLLAVKEWSLSLIEIQKNINDARFSFFLSDILFSPFSYLPGEKIDSVYHAIKGGKHLSKWLDDSMALYTKVDTFMAEKTLSEIYFTQLFLNIYNDLIEIERSFTYSKESYEKINWLPNNDLILKKNVAISSLSDLTEYLQEFRIWFREFTWILGHEKRKKYLIVFQNADEIRPTWWFMWSMALAEIFKWQLKLFQKKDVYAIEWDLKSADYERLLAPKWINELTENFWLRDANYFVNIKDSSNAIKFFTNEAGLDIDGVIYINQNILLSLLDITGPVFFESIGREVSSDNFSEIMSLLVEAKVSKQWTLWTPKQILFEFIEVFVSELTEQGKYFDYLQVLLRETENRDVMMWSFDMQENQFLSNIWLTWDINYDSSLDYFYPVYTSLSWNKSDRYMERAYTHEVFKSSQNCDFTITSTIESSHNMTNARRTNIQNLIEEYNLESPNLLEIQWNQRNRQFVRVILPNDAIIQEDENYTIIEYWKRKWVEFFLETRRQEKTRFTLEYVLPNPECREYSFTLYKQPWIRHHDLILNIENSKYTYNKIDKDFFFKKNK